MAIPKRRCPDCNSALEPNALGCGICGTALEVATATERAELDERAASVLVTTTPGVDGRRVEQYLGPVFGDAIVGAGLFSDWAASVRDVVGGRSGAYENRLAEARDVALAELRQVAASWGANAVIGVRLDSESPRGSMLMVTAQGSAVVLTDGVT